MGAPTPAVRILTFDIEDWFHILDNKETRSEVEWGSYVRRIEPNVDRILHLLAEVDQAATFFCLGWVARQHPRLIRRIADEGHEIACHSDMHQLVYDLGPSGFRSDLRSALASLQDASGKPVKAYRAPGFSVTEVEAPWFFQILGEEGIEVDCSIFPGRHGHGGIANFAPNGPCCIRLGSHRIKEFPMSKGRVLNFPIVYSGGGYFRLTPYAVVRLLAQKQEYVMTYFHPRDFDPTQPRVPGLSRWRRFKSYCGLTTSLQKLRRLVRDTTFIDLRGAVSRVDWDGVPSVEICNLDVRAGLAK